MSLNGEKESFEELGDSNSALNDIRNPIEEEEKRTESQSEFYDGDKDQDDRKAGSSADEATDSKPISNLEKLLILRMNFRPRQQHQ